MAIPNLILNPVIKIFYKLSIHGKENIPSSGGIILLGQQANLLTVLVTEVALQRKIYWAVSQPIFQSKLLNSFLKILLKSFPLNPEIPDIKGFRSAFSVLRKEGLLAFYPGGVNKGIALFCLRAGYGILPMLIIQKEPRLHQIKIIFGSECNMNKYKGVDLSVEVIEDIIQRIKQSFEELKT